MFDHSEGVSKRFLIFLNSFSSFSSFGSFIYIISFSNIYLILLLSCLCFIKFSRFWIWVFYDYFWIWVFYDYFWIWVFYDYFWIWVFYDYFWIGCVSKTSREFCLFSSFVEYNLSIFFWTVIYISSTLGFFVKNPCKTFGGWFLYRVFKLYSLWDLKLSFCYTLSVFI
jgi:hypothetical protein